MLSCVISGLIIGLIGNNGLKYALVFGIGSYIVLIIYVISIICKLEMIFVWFSGGMLLGICTFAYLIMGFMEDNINLFLSAYFFIIVICTLVFVMLLCCQCICN